MNHSTAKRIPSIMGSLKQRETKLPFEAWRFAYPEGNPPARADWLRDVPANFVGAWEPLAFRKRAGIAWADESEAFRQEFSDANLDRIAALGCTHMVVPFSKGFGLKALADEREIISDAMRRARARGLRAGLYLRLDCVIPDVLREEYPDVDEWLTIGEMGRRSYYSPQQTFRVRICHLHPGAMDYLERMIRHAAVEMGADLLHLDGIHFSFYPSETCRCDRCKNAYRSWLKNAYPDAEIANELFGPVDFDRIELPSFDPLQQVEDPTASASRGIGDSVRSPDIQSWYRFRWDGELALMRHLRRYIHQLRPSVAVSINPAWGNCFNGYRIFTQWAERMLPWVDAVWSEDPLHLNYSDGRLVSKLGMYKVAREYGISILNYHWLRDSGRLEASLALSAAANGGHLACLGFTIRNQPHFTLGAEVKARVSRWVSSNWKLFRNTKPRGEIALLRHQPSLAWNSRVPWWSANAMEQLLPTLQIPWRVFDRIDSSLLRQIRTLLLPDAVCLSDLELAILTRWVEHEGGQLLVTAGTASHNEHNRRRPRNPLASWVPGWKEHLDTIGAAESWFEWLENDDSSARLPASIITRGKGKIGFWPRIDSKCGKSSLRDSLQPEDFQLPERAKEMADFVLNLHGEFLVKLHAPLSTMIEHHQSEGGAQLIHLVQVREHVKPADAILVGALFNDIRDYQIHTFDDRGTRLEKCESGVRVKSAGRYVIVELG